MQHSLPLHATDPEVQPGLLNAMTVTTLQFRSRYVSDYQYCSKEGSLLFHPFSLGNCYAHNYRWKQTTSPLINNGCFNLMLAWDNSLPWALTLPYTNGKLKQTTLTGNLGQIKVNKDSFLSPRLAFQLWHFETGLQMLWLWRMIKYQNFKHFLGKEMPIYIISVQPSALLPWKTKH